MACRSSTKVLVFLALLLGSGLASGQGADAEQLVRSGVELRRSGREAEALVTFRRARAIAPSPRIDAQIGLAEQALNMWLEAEDDLAKSLGAPDDAWVKKNRETLEAAARLVATKLAWLVVRSNVANATLIVGGRDLGSLAAPENAKRRVVAGQTTVELRAEGHTSASRSVLVVPERETTVAIDLDASPAVAPGASRGPVFVDAPAPVAPSARAPLGWIVLGAGALGIGVGGAFGLRTIALKDDRDADCVGGCSRAGVEADDDGRTAGLISTVAFAAGGAAVAAGLYLLLTAPSRPARRPSGFSPGPWRLGGRF